MRLSTKGRYAVMAMADLAKNGRAADGQTRAVSLAEIAARQEISLSYLEQLFARLRRIGGGLGDLLPDREARIVDVDHQPPRQRAQQRRRPAAAGWMRERADPPSRRA